MAKKDKERLLIPAGIWIGLGIGMIFNQVVAGVLIGVDEGF